MQRRIHAPVDELTFLRLEKKKQEDGFRDGDWGDWLRWLVKDVALHDSYDVGIEKATRENLLKLWIKNFQSNLPRILEGRDISELVPLECREMRALDPPPPGLGSAIVVGRGPSIFAKKHLELLAKTPYEGTIMATDGSLKHCLEAGVVPTHVLSIDGHPELIRKHYEHELVRRFAPTITSILNATCAPNVAEIVQESGFQGPFWFNPMFDDPYHPQNESFTKIMNNMTTNEKHPKGLADVSVGGHAGAGCWVLAWQLLRRNPVCLIGIDLGYLPETEPEKMDYYKSFVTQSVLSNQPLSVVLEQQLRTVHNPGFDCDCLVDPVFSHYGKSFRELVESAPFWVRTVNSTEGGQVWHERKELIECKPFAEFLKENPR